MQPKIINLFNPKIINPKLSILPLTVESIHGFLFEHAQRSIRCALSFGYIRIEVNAKYKYKLCNFQLLWNAASTDGTMDMMHIGTDHATEFGGKFTFRKVKSMEETDNKIAIRAYLAGHVDRTRTAAIALQLDQVSSRISERHRV